MERKDARFVSTMGLVIAILLLIFVNLAVDNATGNLVKSLTYGLAVGNMAIAMWACRDAWRKE